MLVLPLPNPLYHVVAHSALPLEKSESSISMMLDSLALILTGKADSTIQGEYQLRSEECGLIAPCGF